MSHENQIACNTPTPPFPTTGGELPAALRAYIRPLLELLGTLESVLRPDPTALEAELTDTQEKADSYEEALEDAARESDDASELIDEAVGMLTDDDDDFDRDAVVDVLNRASALAFGAACTLRTAL